MRAPKSRQYPSKKTSKNETISIENINHTANLNKNSINKKSAREKSIENLKNNIKKYTEKQKKN